MSVTRLLQFLIPSGNPNGLKVISMPGWSGKCYVVPRQSVKELQEQSDNNKPGLYILFGEQEGADKKQAYVGESENFFKRLTGHTKGTKEFWETAVVFTGGLNKAYVKYLEHLATLLAKEAGRMDIDNIVQPPENSLSDFDKIAVEQYFVTVRFVLSALNYEIFDRLEESLVGQATYYLKLTNVDASAKLLDNGSMLVLAGSLASKTESPSYSGWTKEERKKYLVDGRFVRENDHSYRLTEDIIFKSPSAAAATFAARSINGWTAWRDASGKTLDENLRK